MKTTNLFSFKAVHPSWLPILQQALTQMDAAYLDSLAHHHHPWLPGKEHIFSAFSIPINQVRFVLFGESPYPRNQSANGYAFYDAAVHELWSPQGLDKRVNRATSLRNLIKMLLLAEGLLTVETLSQTAIAELDKTDLVKTNDALFQNFLSHGFLLLNASLVLQDQSVSKDAKAWRPFQNVILQALCLQSNHITWLLWGRVAALILPLLNDVQREQIMISEHPYNLSFIKQPDILNLFQSLHLLIEK